MSTKVKIQVEVNAALDHVWRCYTEPGQITRWNFASDDWCCPWAENDMRVGGIYKARMEAKDGSFGFEFEATYDAIEPGRLLRYTMPNGRVVETRFAAISGGTHVETVFDAEDQNPVEMQRDGWQAILNNFKKHAEVI